MICNVTANMQDVYFCEITVNSTFRMVVHFKLGSRHIFQQLNWMSSTVAGIYVGT